MRSKSKCRLTKDKYSVALRTNAETGIKNKKINRQFHQRFTHTFFVQNFGAQNYKAVFCVEIFWIQNIGKKSARKMLMKLTPEDIKLRPAK